MRNLEQSLFDHELIVLRVIGEWWEQDLTGLSKIESVKTLVEVLSRLNMPAEINFLGPEEAEALGALVEAGGRETVAAFERQFGQVRQMGPGRLEREEPWYDPVSPAEALWYRGFLYRAFDESDESQMVEFYYLPTELYEQFPRLKQVAGHPVAVVVATMDAVEPPDRFFPSETDAIDDLTAVLAASLIQPVREGQLSWLNPLLLNTSADRLSMLVTLAWELQLFRATDEGARPARRVVDWLRLSREQQLRDLAEAWSGSAWNDLCHTPGLVCEGSGWQNDPILARTVLLDTLPRQDSWYRLGDLVDTIFESDPDFQRPDGNYDTWYIRDRSTGQYLTGFDNWPMVEGRMLRFVVQGPMAWLGLAETAVVDGQEEELLYRLTGRAIDWLENRPAPEKEVTVPIVVLDDASIRVPFNADRYQRFQVARICEPLPLEPGQPFHYQLTPTSLTRARDQGIDPGRVLSFLGRASGRPIPPSTKRAIERWNEQGTEGRLEQVTILRVRDPDILDKLRANPKTRPYIAESMGDLSAVVRAGDWHKLRQAAAQLGLLLDAS